MTYCRVAAATSNIVSLTFRVSGDHLPTDDLDINERVARACRRRRRRLYQRHTDWRSLPPRSTRHWTAPWRTRRADGPRAVVGRWLFFLHAAWRDDRTRRTYKRCLVVRRLRRYNIHLFRLYFYSWIKHGISIHNIVYYCYYIFCNAVIFDCSALDPRVFHCSGGECFSGHTLVGNKITSGKTARLYK